MDSDKLKQRIVDDIGEFTQGWSEVGIKGRRDVDRRLALYNLPLTKDMSVVDLGCNIGFMSLALAKQCRTVIGIDNHAPFICLANDVKHELGISNAYFMVEDVMLQDCGLLKADMVLSCQVHMWTRKPFPEYLDALIPRVKKYLLFESHDVRNVDRDYNEKVNLIIRRGFRAIDSGSYTENNADEFYVGVRRGPAIIPRAFTLFERR